MNGQAGFPGGHFPPPKGEKPHANQKRAVFSSFRGENSALPNRCGAGVLSAALALSLLLGGCGLVRDRHALEQLRPAETLGYDRLPDGTVLLSAAVGAPEDETLTLTGTGQDLRKAMEALKQALGEGELFLPNIRSVLCGDAAAREGLGELLDYVLRDEGLGLGMELLLLRGTAADTVTAEDPAVSEALRAALAGLPDDRFRSSFRETVLRLREDGAAPVRLLEVRREGDAAALVCAGLGILRDGALAGTVTGHAAEAAEALLGCSADAVRRLGGQSLACTLSPCAFRTEPEGVRMTVRVRVTSQTGESGRGAAERALQDAVERETAEVLRLSQELGADWLGLGRALRREAGADPETWLSGLDVSVTAKIEWESEDDTQ